MREPPLCHSAVEVVADFGGVEARHAVEVGAGGAAVEGPEAAVVVGGVDDVAVPPDAGIGPQPPAPDFGGKKGPSRALRGGDGVDGAPHKAGVLRGHHLVLLEPLEAGRLLSHSLLRPGSGSGIPVRDSLVGLFDEAPSRLRGDLVAGVIGGQQAGLEARRLGDVVGRHDGLAERLAPVVALPLLVEGCEVEGILLPVAVIEAPGLSFLILLLRNRLRRREGKAGEPLRVGAVDLAGHPLDFLSASPLLAVEEGKSVGLVSEGTALRAAAPGLQGIRPGVLNAPIGALDVGVPPEDERNNCLVALEAGGVAVAGRLEVALPGAAVLALKGAGGAEEVGHCAGKITIPTLKSTGISTHQIIWSR